MLRIGLNVNNQQVAGDRAWLLDTYITRGNPSTMLFMNGFQETRDAYARHMSEHPDTDPVYIYRSPFDLGADTWWKSHDANAALNVANGIYRNAPSAKDNIWLYIVNEPHATGEADVRFLARRLESYVRTLCRAGYKVVVGNFSSGTVDNPQWMEGFLDAVSVWGKQGRALLSEHWYSAPHYMAGFNRILDDNGDVRLMSHEESLDYYDMSYWLNKAQVQAAFDGDGNPLWHYGRISRLYRYARGTMGLPMPGFVVTEGLMDGMPDLQAHDRRFERNGYTGTLYDHLEREYGTSYAQIKGDLSYDKVWADWYGSYDEGLYRQLAWMNRVLPDECVGVTLFTASWASDWDRYGHNFFRAKQPLTRLATDTAPPPPQPPQPPQEDTVNLTDYVFPNPGHIHALSSQERIWGEYIAPGNVLVRKNMWAEHLFVHDGYIWRGADTSAWYKGQSGRHGMYIPSTGQPFTLDDYNSGKHAHYGMRWLPTQMNVGDTFISPSWVNWFAYQPFEESPATGATENIYRLEASYPSWDGVSDVVEVGWYVGGALQESYFFGRGRGYVGWQSHSTGQSTTYVGDRNDDDLNTETPYYWGTPTPIRKRVTFDWFDPTNININASAPPPPSDDTWKPHTFTGTRQNVRGAPSLSGAVITQLSTGTAFDMGTQRVSNDGYTWAQIRLNGEAAWIALVNPAYYQPVTGGGDSGSGAVTIPREQYQALIASVEQLLAALRGYV